MRAISRPPTLTTTASAALTHAFESSELQLTRGARTTAPITTTAIAAAASRASHRAITRSMPRSPAWESLRRRPEPSSGEAGGCRERPRRLPLEVDDPIPVVRDQQLAEVVVAVHARDARRSRSVEGRLEPAPDPGRQAIQGGAVDSLQRIARLVELRQRGVAPASDLGGRRLADRKREILRSGREAVVQLRGHRPDRAGSSDGT